MISASVKTVRQWSLIDHANLVGRLRELREEIVTMAQITQSADLTHAHRSLAIEIDRLEGALAQRRSEYAASCAT